MRKWEKEDVYFGGELFFSKLINEIHTARKSVYLETYIFCDDELGRSVAEALNRASARGLKVRLLIDGVGSGLAAVNYLFSNLAKSIDFKVYHPVPWSLSLGALQNSSGIKSFLKLFFSINRRNHRKVCIVDNKVAFVGSMNVCASHSSWRDTGVRVQGEGVGELTAAFYKTWQSAELPAPTSRWKFLKRHKTGLVRLNDTWYNRHRIFLDLLKRIGQAKSRIWISSAYFVPHRRLVKALAEAAARGVDVRVLGPRRCDVFFIPLVRSMFYEFLLKSHVRIFEYLPTMFHAKTMIIDSWATVGSSNLNHRSLRHDLEVDLTMTHDESLKVLVRQFLTDLRSSAEVNSEHLRERPWLESGSGQALLLLKNWM